MSTNLDRVLERFAEKGYLVKQYGDEYRCQCPAHNGTDQNFAFSEGDDGRILFTCHSHKCSYDEICQALGFEPAELMGAGDSNVLPNSTYTAPTKPVATGGKTLHSTLEKALGAAAFGIDNTNPREPDVVYTYRNIDGSENLFIARWNINGKKEIRPVSKIKDGYIVGKHSDQIYPIYGIDLLDKYLQKTERSNVRVYICEGEKATEMARHLGLLATCSPFGSESAAKADWDTLDEIAVKYKKSLELVILPDNDSAGEEYAKSLGEIFGKFKSRPTVKIVRFAEYCKTIGINDFPEKGDICEFCELFDSKTEEEIKTMIDHIADQITAEPEDMSLVMSLAYCSRRAFEEIISGKPPTVWNVAPRADSALNKLQLAPGKVVVIGGAPGVGKTAFFMQLVFDALRYNPGLKVLICNVEMDPQILLYREFARQTEIPLVRIQNRDISLTERVTLEDCMQQLIDLGKRCYFQMSPFSADRIIESVRMVDADIVILDYAQRFNINERSNPDIKEKLKILLDLARNEIAMKGKCVLLASALNRTPTSGKNTGDYSGAGITSFRDSSELEYSVDDAYILGYGPKKDARNERLLTCLKKRSGEPSDILIEFDGAHQRFFVPGENIISEYANDFAQYSGGN
ncbi:MAG: DnaB-like helicase C-terminal domain-containing protein [Thermoguttaceae bacterium]|nr:DnaB-like helicase C-terminal domain-containing protein [Thermoguttaceae bacterium]